MHIYTYIQGRLVHWGQRGRAPSTGYITVCKLIMKSKYYFLRPFIFVIHHQNGYFPPILFQNLPIGGPHVGPILPMLYTAKLSTDAPPSSISLQHKWKWENWSRFIWVHGIIDTVILWMYRSLFSCYRVIPYVTVTIFAAFFGLVLPVNYLLFARDQLLFACL